MRACVITDGRAPDIASLYDADGCSGSASSLEPYLHSPAHVTWSLAADWLSGDVGGAWPDTWRIPAQLAVGEDVSFCWRGCGIHTRRYSSVLHPTGVESPDLDDRK